MTGRFAIGPTPEPPDTSTGADRRPAGPRRRILVIDDDPAIASALVDLLESTGYVVDVSANGTDGFRLAVAAHPDLILLDVNLPPTDGFDAAARIRKSPSAQEIPILFLSGVRDLALRMRRLAIDDVDFLPKPFGDDELLTRIERVLTTARARQTLHRQAERDELTSLGNLRRFQARLADEHARFARYAEALSLVAIDVDKLKRINDEHGHPAGDEALRAIAEVLRREVRDVDVAARCGGDEFLVILPHTTLPHAAVFAERVLNAVRRVSVLGVQLSVSIGVASLNRPGSVENSDQLLRRADAAAYRAKRAGGGRICLADDD